MKRSLIILFAVIFLSGCIKTSTSKTYIIKGQVLESTSNPVPLSDYSISIYQRSDNGLLGGVSGIDSTIKTGNDGRFEFKYSANKNYGFSTGGINTNEISIRGVDPVKFKDLYPEWYRIPSVTDINLSPIYLYKNIELLVRKVQFNTSLNAGESLEVITTNASGASYKTLTGPIQRGTLLVVDTIKNCKLCRFNLTSKEYAFSATLKKPSFQKDLTIVMTQGDEAYREVLMIY